MSVEMEIASQAAAPLLGMPGWPTVEATQAEIIRAIARTSKSSAHARAMVEAWMRDNRFAPSPHDIYQIADEVADPEPAPPRPAGCRRCEGTGLRSWEVPKGSGYWYCGPCQCPAGQARRRTDNEAS